jgi:putative ABC transport system permease protein
MLAIGEGASRDAQERIARLGSRNIIVKTVKPAEDMSASGEESDTASVYGLTYDDAERFRQTIPDVEVVVPVRRISQQAWYRNRKVAVEVIGTIPWYPEISSIKLKQGRFLSSIDMYYKRGICIVDDSVINSLFVVDEPLGKHIKIKDSYYRVVGVVSAAGPIEIEQDTPLSRSGPGPGGGGVTGNVYIPLTTFKSIFGELSAQFSGGRQSMEKVELQEIVVKVNSMQSVLATRDILDSLLSRFHEKKDYQIVVPLQLLREAARTKRIFSIVLGSIAAISLLVGGIGIMNIMLATVTERTREIGIRRALGARRRDIVVQFLSETVMLTLTGGLVGILLGSLIPYLVTRFVNMPTVVTGISLVLSFGISAIIGITFGIYPAYRAANMDPIESLRHE